MPLPEIVCYPNEGEAPCIMATMQRENDKLELWQYPATYPAARYSIESFANDDFDANVKEFDSHSDAIAYLFDVAMGIASFP